MGDITTADLLTVQRNITEANRTDNIALRTEVTAQLGVVREEIGELRSEQRSQQQELVELRTVIQERTKPLGVLTRQQKKLAWTAAVAVGGACLEGLRHVASWAFAAAAHTFGAGVKP